MEQLEMHVQDLIKDKEKMKMEIMNSKEEIERANQLRVKTEKKNAILQQQRARNENGTRFVDIPDVFDDDMKSKTHHLLSLALFEKGELQQAVVELYRSLDLNDENSQVWYDLGRMEFELKHFAEAQDALESALRLKPTCSKSKSLLPKVLHAIGNHEAAISAYYKIFVTDNGSSSDHDHDLVDSSTING